MRRQNKLQVYQDGRWSYVFCNNQTPVWNEVGWRNNSLVTTEKKSKALHADNLDYFSETFKNLLFRAV
jgi:hypothetical protein